MNAEACAVAIATCCALGRRRKFYGGTAELHENTSGRGTLLRRLRRASSRNFNCPPLGRSMERPKGAIRRPVPGHTKSPSPAFFASKT